MKYAHMATLLKYMIVSIFMVFPAFSADARTRDDAGIDSDISGTALATIDRNRPEKNSCNSFLQTAIFYIGG